jgi:phenylalanyl-tRNA synthetase beta chain
VLRPSRQRTVLGVDVPEARAAGILEGLGFAVDGVESEGRRIGIPTWRSDVNREADLIEEVGRHYGLDRIPATLPAATRGGHLREAQRGARAVREVLVGAGLDEVVRLSFVSPGLESRSAVPIANPLADVEGLLRSSLVDPGLLDALRRNQSHGRHDVRVFEIGRVFAPSGAAVEERTQLGLLVAGSARPRHWSEPARSVDFFDAKGLLELLAARMGWTLGFGNGPLPPWLHSGKRAALLVGGEALGYVGALHPEAAARLELRGETVVAELHLDPLFERKPPAVRAQALPRHPAVTRDLSVLVDRSVEAQELVRWAREGAGPLLRGVDVSDRYDRAPVVPEGKVSLMLTLRYQETERTLTSEEVQASVQGAARSLKEHGAEIRGE